MTATGPEMASSLPATDSAVAAVIGIAILILLAYGISLNRRMLLYLRRHPGWLSRRLRHLRRRPWPPADSASIMLPVALLYAAVTLSGSLLLRGPEPPFPPIATAILLTTILNLGIVAIVLRALRRSGCTWKAAFGSARAAGSPGKAAIAGYVAMLPAMAIVTLSTHLVMHASGMTPGPQDILIAFSARGASPWLRALLGVTAVLTAPLAEELLFRGVLLPGLLRHWRAPVAIVVSSVLFAALHGHLTAFAPLIAASVAFSLCYAATGSIWAPILMHTLFNAASLLLLTLSQLVNASPVP